MSSDVFLHDHRTLADVARVGGSATDSDRLRLLEAERDVYDMLIAYTLHYDGVDLDALAALFTADAVLHNVRGTHVGREEIRANFNVLTTVLSRSLHFITNVTIRILDDDTASAASYLYSVAQRRADGVIYGSGGTYIDKLRRVDGRWQIAERRITAQLPHELTAFAPSYVVPPESA